MKKKNTRKSIMEVNAIQSALPRDEIIERKLADLKTEFIALSTNRNNTNSIIRIQDHLNILRNLSFERKNEIMDDYVQAMLKKIGTLADKSLDSFSYMNQLYAIMDLRDYIEFIMLFPYNERSKYSHFIKKCIGKMAPESSVPPSFVNGTDPAGYDRNR